MRLPLISFLLICLIGFSSCNTYINKLYRDTNANTRKERDPEKGLFVETRDHQVITGESITLPLFGKTIKLDDQRFNVRDLYAFQTKKAYFRNTIVNGRFLIPVARVEKGPLEVYSITRSSSSGNSTTGTTTFTKTTYFFVLDRERDTLVRMKSLRDMRPLLENNAYTAARLSDYEHSYRNTRIFNYVTAAVALSSVAAFIGLSGNDANKPVAYGTAATALALIAVDRALIVKLDRKLATMIHGANEKAKAENDSEDAYSDEKEERESDKSRSEK